MPHRLRDFPLCLTRAAFRCCPHRCQEEMKNLADPADARGVEIRTAITTDHTVLLVMLTVVCLLQKARFDAEALMVSTANKAR